jgi:hypothetical protein
MSPLSQREVDVGEEMAELAKAHGQVERRHAQQEGGERLEIHQQSMQQRKQRAGNGNAQAPGDGAVTMATVVKFVFQKAGQRRLRPPQGTIDRQRVQLFEDQRDDDGESGSSVQAPGKEALQGYQHARRGAPDEVTPARAWPSTHGAGRGSSMLWRWWLAVVEEEFQRRLEHLGDFEIVELEVQRRRHQADHRGDDEAGTGAVFGQAAEDLDLRRRRARLPPRLRAGRCASAKRRSASQRPPGKLTWPAWSRRCAVRCVSNMVGPVGRMTTGTRTAAGISSDCPRARRFRRPGARRGLR